MRYRGRVVSLRRVGDLVEAVLEGGDVVRVRAAAAGLAAPAAREGAPAEPPASETVHHPPGPPAPPTGSGP